MRPTTLWDEQAILAYFPKPQAEKLRYMIIRASELAEAGVVEANNGFFTAVDSIQAAINTELTDAGFTPTTLNESMANGYSSDVTLTSGTVIPGDDVVKTIESYIDSNTSLEEALGLKDIAIGELNDKLKEQEDELTEQDEEIANLKAIIAERDEALATLNTTASKAAKKKGAK